MSAVQPPVQAVEKAEVKMNRISRFRLLIALLVLIERFLATSARREVRA